MPELDVKTEFAVGEEKIKNNMRVGILTFEQFRGKRNLGSSKIRGHWVVDKWPEAELFVQGQKYDVVIYEKAYFVEHARVFKGIKIFDLCDPDFLHWGYRTMEMINECDAVTTSTQALADTISKFTDKPVVHISDKVNLDEIKKRKYHRGNAKWVCWFGYSTNFDMLKPVIPALKRLNLNLTVISDGGFNVGIGYADSIELKNLPFNWKTAYDDIIDNDIVINPQSIKGKWKYKSNNKTLLAWALGMSVAEDLDDLERFIDEGERRKEQLLRYKELEEKWDVKYSVEEYRNLINSLLK